MNETKIKKLSSLFITAVFLGFIFALSLLSLYGAAKDNAGYSFFENRTLASLPAAEKDAILDGSFFAQIDSWYRDHTAKRNGILAYDTLLNMNVLKRPVVNDTVITDDMLLPYNSPETVDAAEIAALAHEAGERMRSHSELCASYGGRFYYVAVPCQYVYYEDRYPQYLNSRADYTAASSEAFFSELDRAGVSYIDMRGVFDAAGHPDEYSSKEDNHYSIFGALETYKALMEKINADTGLGLDIMDEGDYTVKSLPNSYLGSRARKLLGLRRFGEKLAVITPNEDIPFTRDGEAPEASSVYALPANDTDDVTYGLYMGGDNAITKIETNRPGLPTVLVYGDSFTNALESLIWYDFDTMYSVDFRHYTGMTLEEFIAEYEPDIVVCVRDYEQLISTDFNGQ